MAENRFDRKAADWDKKKQRLELAAAVSTSLAELPLSAEMTAMDFGCGTGLVSVPLAAKLKKIIALDSSKGMLEVLREKISLQQIDNIIPLLGDITLLSFDHSFDLIFTSMTLHHIENTDAVLDKFSELLVPGGSVAIADLDAEDGSFHAPGSGEKHHGFHRHEMEKKLLDRGFTKITFQTVHHIEKKDDDGQLKSFGVFLATAVKH